MRTRLAVPQRFASLVILIAALAVPVQPAAADDYPTRAVKIIVPFGAGGPTDVYARAIADELRKSLHQTFIMENRPGAGTTIGTELVARAAPNGFTLLMVSGTQAVNETLSHRDVRRWSRCHRDRRLSHRSRCPRRR